MLNKPTYITTAVLWVLVTQFIVFLSLVSNAYMFMFLPINAAGVISAIIMPLFIKRRKKAFWIGTVSCAVLHIIGLVTAFLLIYYSRYEPNPIFIIIPAVMSFGVSALQLYVMFHMNKIKDFFYEHDKMLIALFVAVVAVILAIIVLDPFERILDALLPMR